MKRMSRTLLVTALLLALALPGVAAAQEGEIAPCSGETVSGTVVAVDEAAGVVTIDTGAGLCTVAVGADYSHPIVGLMGAYFGEVSLASLAEALAALAVQVSCVEDEGVTTCSLSAEGQAGKVTGVVDNGDGTYTLLVEVADAEGDTSTLMVTVDDAGLAASFSGALATLEVSWTLVTEDDGSVRVADAGDEIAALHEEGWGFGDLVKAYAIVAQVQEACEEGTLEGDVCSLTVEQVLAEYEAAGEDWGPLFEQYGRPSILGIGHLIMQSGPPGGGGPDGQGPPPHACGYWLIRPFVGHRARGEGTDTWLPFDPSTGNPCANRGGDGETGDDGEGPGGPPVIPMGRGRPPWVSPGGGDDDGDDD